MADIMKVGQIQVRLLEEVADLHEVPAGAYNIRASGQLTGRASFANIKIVSKEDETGIDIHTKPGTEQESVHIPVVLSQSDLTRMVYNDFYVGGDADVVIMAGCDIHSGDDKDSEHNGIHRLFLGKSAKVKYVEKHYGEGDGRGRRILNPGTEVTMEENSHMEMETAQIKGVDSAKRDTTANLAAGAKLIIRERLLTHGSQDAVSGFVMNLSGDGSSADVIFRSVVKDDPSQTFLTRINGNAKCAGHSECDATIIGNAKIGAIPKITASNTDVALIREAAIGEIAEEQLTRLMTLGLTEVEAKTQIVNGFLK